MPFPKPFFSLPCNHPAHARMARLLRAVPPDEAVGTWRLVELDLGRDRAWSMDPLKARHLSERIIRSAERNGFLRRLPTKVVSSSPRGHRPIPGVTGARVDKELAYVLTEEGRLFQERHFRHMRSIAGSMPQSRRARRRRRERRRAARRLGREP